MKEFCRSEVSLCPTLAVVAGVNFTARPLYPLERAPVRIEQGAEWALEPVLTFWRRETFYSVLVFEPRIVQPLA